MTSQNINHDFLGRIIKIFFPTVILCNFSNFYNNMSQSEKNNECYERTYRLVVNWGNSSRNYFRGALAGSNWVGFFPYKPEDTESYNVIWG